MKLIIAVVQDGDSGRVTDEFIENNLRITKMSSTGGFLRAGNTTLLAGVEDCQVDKATSILSKCKATVFIANVERFEKY